MDIIFQVTTQLRMNENKKVLNTDINLEFSKNIDRDRYFLDGKIPNKDGFTVTIATLTQGIIAAMLSAHNEGLLDSAETLRSVIADLEHGFVQVANTQVAEFKKLESL